MLPSRLPRRCVRTARRRDSGIRMRFLPLGLLVLVSAAISFGGCYEPRRGNPVDYFHYEHSIGVSPDYGHVCMQTYVNRSHLRVGLERLDLHDGDLDGKLQTQRMDRVVLTSYIDIEDPPENAVRTIEDIRDYDALFQKVIEAARSGAKTIEIEGRTYKIRPLS